MRPSSRGGRVGSSKRSRGARPSRSTWVADQAGEQRATAAVVGIRRGDVFAVVTASTAEDAALVAGRMRQARQRGDPPRPGPTTPMRAVAPGAVFVSVPAVSFVPFPPPEDEPPPAAPSLAGATAVDGRIGSVAGERRATVWSLSTDPAVFATAEDLEGSLAGLASSRAGGAPAGPVELVDRVVFAADGGEDGSARAFRHGNVAVLVEGADPADLDAIVSAWITVLGPP